MPVRWTKKGQWNSDGMSKLNVLETDKSPSVNDYEIEQKTKSFQKREKYFSVLSANLAPRMSTRFVFRRRCITILAALYIQGQTNSSTSTADDRAFVDIKLNRKELP